MKQFAFKKRSFKIYISKERSTFEFSRYETVTGIVLKNLIGIHCNEDDQRRYHITHIPTGIRICPFTFPVLMQAKIAAHFFLICFDNCFLYESLVSVMKKNGKEMLDAVYNIRSKRITEISELPCLPKVDLPDSWIDV